MAIKEIPTKLTEYKTACMRAYSAKKEEFVDTLKEKEEESTKLHNKCVEYVDQIKKEYNVDLNSYEEFVDNKYTTGKFVRTAKGMYIKGGGEFEVIAELYEIYKYSLLLEEIHDIQKQIELCDKVLSVSAKQYVEFMESYFLKVHEKLILDGYGYVFGHNIGCVCVNRVKQYSKKKLIDYKKTKERKEQLLAEGKKLYNKEEEAQYHRMGMEYNGVDYRVYKDNEYNYEVCLFDCKFENANSYEFIASDWRNKELRGKTNDDLIKECHYNTEEIVKLKVDVKTKANLCTQVDDIFYTKFIRNEDQKSYRFGKADRKN